MYKSLTLALAVAFAAVLAMVGAPLKADTITSGGVSYTVTYIETDSPNVYDVELSVDTTGETASETLSSLSIQFTGATNVTLETAPTGSTGWSVLGEGPNGPTGCNINGSANHWCAGGSGLGVGTFDFLFDVTMPNGTPLPTGTHIQAFQGTSLAISDDVGIGVPEPASASLLLIGMLGLMGMSLVRRKVTL